MSSALAARSVKLGIFVAVGIALLGYLVAKVGSISFFQSRTTYHVLLADATGLVPSDQVKIAGVAVGAVDGVTVRHGLAFVTFGVNSDIHLRSSTDAGLRWHNVIGEQYLYLYPGTTGKQLAAGATIPSSHDVSSASVGALLNSLGPFLQAINPQEVNAFVVAVLDAVQGNTAQINQLVSSAASLSSTLGSLSGTAGSLIGNFSQILPALAAHSSSLTEVISNLNQVVSSLSSRNILLDSSVADLSQVSADLATLLATNQHNISGAVDGLDTVTGQVERNDVPLAQGLRKLGPAAGAYRQISALGQWFELNTVYTCIAGQQLCSYYSPLNTPPGSGPFGAPPGSGPQAPATPGLPQVPGQPVARAAGGDLTGTGALSKILEGLATGGGGGGGAK